MLAHGIEVVSSDSLTTFTKSNDKIRVVEGEGDVGNLGSTILRLALLGLALAEELLLSPSVVLDPLVKFHLDFLLHVLFEGKSWGDALLEVATRLAVLLLLPSKVALLEDRELNSVITGSDSGAIPLDLLDLATLEHEADGGGEKESDEAGGADSECHLIVLLLLGGLFLYASVLHEQG
jgi:hypothetical protein